MKFLQDLVLVASLAALIFGLGLFFGFAPKYTTGLGLEGLAQFISLLAGTTLFLLYLILGARES